MLIKRGMTGPLVAALQQNLEDLGYELGSVDGAFGKNTEAAVKDFQAKKGLGADGVVGPKTLQAIDAALKAAGKEGAEFDDQPEEAPAVIQEVNVKMGWVTCPADKYPGKDGYGSTILRTDAAAAYKELKAEINALGGVVTSAGGRRALSSGAGPARSKTSMHYTGLAFDMSLATGMQSTERDPFLCVRVPDSRKWTVWCKSDKAPEVELDVVTCSTVKGKTQLKTTKMKVKAFNFTEVAEKHGFYSISARKSFFEGGAYGGAEWWHFQYNKALTKGQSKFGEELLKVYSLNEAQKFVYWNEVKDNVYGVNWF
jgi:Putative peptidoglycan binding domain